MINFQKSSKTLIFLPPIVGIAVSHALPLRASADFAVASLTHNEATPQIVTDGINANPYINSNETHFPIFTESSIVSNDNQLLYSANKPLSLMAGNQRSLKTNQSLFKIDDLRIDFASSYNSDQSEWFDIQATLRISSLDKSRYYIQSGYSYLDSKKLESITNYSWNLAWEKPINHFLPRVGMGVEMFNGYPTRLTLDTTLAYRLPLRVVDKKEESFIDFALAVNNDAVKSIQSINAGITKWEITPRLGWQIDPSTNLNLAFGLRLYSDSNTTLNPSIRINRRLFQGFDIGIFASSINHSDEDYPQRPGYSTRDNYKYGFSLRWEKEFINPELVCGFNVVLGKTMFTELDLTSYTTQNYRVRCRYNPNSVFQFSLGYEYFRNDIDGTVSGSVADNNKFVSQILYRF